MRFHAKCHEKLCYYYQAVKITFVHNLHSLDFICCISQHSQRVINFVFKYSQKPNCRSDISETETQTIAFFNFLFLFILFNCEKVGGSPMSRIVRSLLDSYITIHMFQERNRMIRLMAFDRTKSFFKLNIYRCNGCFACALVQKTYYFLSNLNGSKYGTLNLVAVDSIRSHLAVLIFKR